MMHSTYNIIKQFKFEVEKGNTWITPSWSWINVYEFGRNLVFSVPYQNMSDAEKNADRSYDEKKPFYRAKYIGVLNPMENIFKQTST